MEQWSGRAGNRFRIKEALDAAEIEMAYPRVVIHKEQPM